MDNKTEHRTLFRQSALERLSSPEQLDQLMKVTTPIGWLALLAIFMLLSAAIIWGFVGRLPVRVQGQGILLSPGGVNNIVSFVSGQIMDIYFEVGDSIKPGQVVARIRETEKATATPVISTFGGYIIEIQASLDSLVERGSPILSVESYGVDGSESLESVLYLSPAEGKQVRPGMDVEISPASVKSELHGYIRGKVISVGSFPATREGMLRTLKNEDLLNILSTGGAPIEIRVDLQTDPANPGNYQWTSAGGSGTTIDSGTLCMAWIIISQERPINLIIPSLR